MIEKQQIKKLVEESEGSYSYDRYRNWSALCKMLLQKGFTIDEATTILCSKWTRWAADYSSKKYGYCTSKDLENFLNKRSSEDFQSLFSEIGITYRNNYVIKGENKNV